MTVHVRVYAGSPARRSNSRTPSGSSTQDTSSQPSSLSFDAPVNRLQGGQAAHMDRETPMLTVRHRPRTTGDNQGMSESTQDESVNFTDGSSEDSSISGQESLDGQTLLDSSSAGPGRRPASRRHSGLDESGRVSAELRQSSSGRDINRCCMVQLTRSESLYTMKHPRCSVSCGQKKCAC